MAAIEISGDVKVSENGFGTQALEAAWHSVTELAPGIEGMNLGVKLFEDNGEATLYMSSLWSLAAVTLSREELNNGVTMVDARGFPDQTFIASWEDLIS